MQMQQKHCMICAQRFAMLASWLLDILMRDTDKPEGLAESSRLCLREAALSGHHAVAQGLV